jgi:hypothetical protein
MPYRRHRLLRLAPAAALFLLTLAAAPASAELRDVDVLFAPEVPIWREPVTAEVRGESECAVYVEDVFVGFAFEIGPLIRFDLAESCTLPPPVFFPFAASVELGRLEPGEYAVQVRRQDDESVVAESELTVYQVADVEIEPPAAPPSDAAPFTFTVTAYDSSCLSPEVTVVTDDAIVVHYPPDCAILPPGPTILETELEVGPLAAGDYEIRVFRDELGGLRLAKRTVRVYDAELCVPSSTVLCLNDDRFRVAVTWKGFAGGSGSGMTVPLRDDTGAFWFFHPANLELTIKVLDGCPVNGHFWVFVASGSTIEYDIEVTDTLARQTRRYGNGLGEVPRLIADTAAFATCP